MAIRVSIPRDLSKVKDKIVFHLTIRQIVCFGMAAIIGVPSFFMVRKHGNVSLAMLSMVFIMIPFFILGMYEKDGQPIEKIVQQYIEAMIKRPVVRRYQSRNLYSLLKEQAQLEKEVSRIVFRNHIKKERKNESQKTGNTRAKREEGRTKGNQKGERK